MRDLRNIQTPERNDLQTVNLFVILAVLTGLFVLGLRLVLFAPNLDLAADRGPAQMASPSNKAAEPLLEKRAQK